MRTSISVTLLGRNAIVREGLRRILEDEAFDIRQSVEHHALIDAQAMADDLLILVDGSVHARDLDQVRALHDRFPTVRLVMLGDRFELDWMLGAFRAGVHGCIVKEMSFEPLIAALRLVAMGEKVMPSPLVDELSRRAAGAETDSARQAMESAHLSGREAEILQYLVMGCPNKIISRRLTISEETVKVHVKAILRKLQVKNRTQAAIRAVSGGMDQHAMGAPPEADVAEPARPTIVRAA